MSPVLFAGFMMLSASFNPGDSGCLAGVEGESGVGVRGTTSCAVFAMPSVNPIAATSSFGAAGASRACVGAMSGTGLAPASLSVDKDDSLIDAEGVSWLECASRPKRHAKPMIEIVAAASKNQESFAFRIFFLSGSSSFVDLATMNSCSPEGC